MSGVTENKLTLDNMKAVAAYSSQTINDLTTDEVKALAEYSPDYHLIGIKYSRLPAPQIVLIRRSERSCSWKASNTFNRFMASFGFSSFIYYEFEWQKIIQRLSYTSWKSYEKHPNTFQYSAYLKVCGLANKFFRLTQSSLLLDKTFTQEIEKQVWQKSLLDGLAGSSKGIFKIWWNSDLTVLDARFQLASQLNENFSKLEIYDVFSKTSYHDTSKLSLEDWKNELIMVYIND